ncbi:MAG: hypothetical protein H6922_03805 [Pseudomonadaceae bacterium]|nr:hypothetical protein [Pseudomonadaceae bacterium]
MGDKQNVAAKLVEMRLHLLALAPWVSGDGAQHLQCLHSLVEETLADERKAREASAPPPKSKR